VSLPVNNSHEQSRQVFCSLHKAHIGRCWFCTTVDLIYRSQVHYLCKTKLVIVIHETDTLSGIFRRIFGGRKFGGEYG